MSETLEITGSVSPLANPIYLASIYRLTAVNFLKSAKILGSSLNLEDSHQQIAALPFYFLVSHAAELLLKSALLKRGLQERELKSNLRHNLKGLLKKLLEKGVSVTPSSVSLVNGLHLQHLSHALRYTALCDDGRKSYMPPPYLMFSMLEELLLLTRISTQGI